MKKTTLALIIPAYNESAIIETVLKDWSDLLKSLEIDFSIHVYNDGSSDNTLAVLEQFAVDKAQIIVHDKTNSGHGPTILKAYRELQDAEWLFQIDSDNEISSRYFSELWDARHNYDFLIGQRVYTSRALSRYLISWFSKLTVQLFYGSGIADVNVPYRLLRRAAFAEIFETIPDNTFAPNIIITGLAIRHKFSFKQIKVRSINRQTGTVSIKHFKLLKSAVLSFYQTIRASSKHV